MARTDWPPHGFRRVPRRCCAIVAVWMLGFLGAAEAADPGSPISSDPIFNALRIDGQEASGRIIAIDPDSITMAIGEAGKEAIPLDRLVKLTRHPILPPSAWEDSQAVILPEGDRLMRTTIGVATDTNLEVRSEALGKLKIPLDSILGLILTAPGHAATFDARWDQVLVEPRSTEVVWLANGDRIDGSFLGMDDRKIKLQIDQKPLEIERTGVLALGFDPTLVNYPKPKRHFLEITLKDGTRLGVTGAKLDDGYFQATTRFGHPVRLAPGDLSRIVVRSESVIYLAERPTAKVQYVSYVGPTRVYRADRSVEGRPFQLGGQSYDRGLGTQSRTFLVYRLLPGDRRFQALIGVDERSGPLGSVVFRVLIDGKERFKSDPLSDRDAPKFVDLDLTDARTLILDTDFGDRGNVRDFADWAEARIIR